MSDETKALETIKENGLVLGSKKDNSIFGQFEKLLDSIIEAKVQEAIKDMELVDEDRVRDVLSDEIRNELNLTGEIAQRMFRNTHENRVNENRKARSTWDVIQVTGRADTRSAESHYLNKKLTPQTAELMDDMNSQWEKINKLRLVKK